MVFLGGTKRSNKGSARESCFYSWKCRKRKSKEKFAGGLAEFSPWYQIKSRDWFKLDRTMLDGNCALWTAHYFWQSFCIPGTTAFLFTFLIPKSQSSSVFAPFMTSCVKRYYCRRKRVCVQQDILLRTCQQTPINCFGPLWPPSARGPMYIWMKCFGWIINDVRIFTIVRII